MGLGAWRFFLAALVANSHLWAEAISGPPHFAVWCFFVLSGFLMTHILSTKYGSSTTGLTAYATNRFLRIYPPYIAAVALTLASIVLLNANGVDAGKLSPSMGVPNTATDWLWTFSMVHVVPRGGPTPIPWAWALFVEVAAYALMPLLARSRGTTWVAFALGLAANLDLGFQWASYRTRYMGLTTAMVAFAAGALICHYRDQLRRFEAPRLSLTAWCLHCLVGLALPVWPSSFGLLASVLLSAWVVLSLGPITGDRADKWLGDLSYPIYLLHMVGGLWMVPLFGYAKGLAFFAASFAFTLALSWLFVILIGRRVDRFKTAAPAALSSNPSRQNDFTRSSRLGRRNTGYSAPAK
jgi:peptidoglycan/LPS O-acetylase OafA/YrhL